MDRRQFLVRAGLGAMALKLPIGEAQAWEKSHLNSMSPAQAVPWRNSTTFTGDHEMEGHDIFWDRDGFFRRKGGIPAVSEHYDTVIIGGGIAGLTSAYYSHGEKVLLMDSHPQFGGNSKLETHGGLGMGLGAAYIVKPDAGGEIDRFLKALGIRTQFRNESADEFTVGLNGKFIRGFWNGATDPVNRSEIIKVTDRFHEIYHQAYPELPLWGEGDLTRAQLNQLDDINFEAWLKKEFGEVHPHMLEFLMEYAWSSFGAGIDELSAAQYLNFITSDLQGIMTLPGGNGAIAKAIFDKVVSDYRVTLSPHTFAVSVRSIGTKSDVTFLRDGKLKTVRCKKCIVAAPKFVAKYFLEDISQERFKAMDQIGKRAYLVANVLLRKNIKSHGHDSYTLHDEVPRSDRFDSSKRVFSDITFADWANYDRSKFQALTLYIPQPYAMAQQFLFGPGANEKYQKRIRKMLPPYLKEMGLTESDIVGIRLTRYGHALPVAKRGHISSGRLELAHRSIENIHFAGQCNWANPAFETAFETGRQAALR